MSGLAGHPGGGPDDPGLVRMFWEYFPMVRVRQGRFCCLGVRTSGRGSSWSGRCPDDPGEGPDDPGKSNCSGFPLGDEFFGGNWMISGQKIAEISWMEGGEKMGDARSTWNQANPHIKINKTSSKPTNHKKNWGYFWRKYALEAIIKLLFISLFHDKWLLFMLEFY